MTSAGGAQALPDLLDGQLAHVLHDQVRAVLLERLAGRIDSRGVLRLVESGSRSQYQNREAVSERLRVMVAAALRPRRKRRKTSPPRASREERLRSKKKRSEVKQQRTRPAPED